MLIRTASTDTADQPCEFLRQRPRPHTPRGHRSAHTSPGSSRVGKATANDAADHIGVLTQALAQLPADEQSWALVRGDAGAGSRRSCTICTT